MKLQALVQLAVVVSTFQVDKAPILGSDSHTTITGEYNIVLKNKLLDREVGEHIQLVRNMIKSHDVGSILHVYDIGTREEKRFRGYGAKLDDKQVDMVRSMSHVKYVERNQEYHTLQADCISELVEPWGIVRTTVRDWPPDVEYIYSYDANASGQGVDVYIIDTGLDLTHPEFEGRVKFGVDTIDNPPRQDDPNGHGTHIAGVVISKSYGIARKATAVAVRVLNAGGSGSIAGVIAGVDWSANNHKQGSGQGKKSVANMSLGGGFSQAMNDAVNAAIDDGLPFTIAAGGSNSNACNFSPASSNGITSASSDKNDKRASSSSYGECVDIFGPGVGILSTIPGGGVAEFSGTSMSAAHIAGVAAKYLSTQPAGLSQDELLKWFQETGTKDKIEGIPSNPPTPNLLPFMECKQTNSTTKDNTSDVK